VRFADIGGNGSIAGENEQRENGRTKKRFHGGSLLCFLLKSFELKLWPWWCIPVF
jgi:hypothetical protein